MSASVRLAIGDASAVGHARRIASELAGHLGFDRTGVGTVALVVTEAASNLVKHAGEGEILLQPLAADGARGLDVIALDRGPGIADAARAARDGFSTSQTPGTGLGAILRAAARSDLYTQPGAGAAVFARLWAGPAKLPERRAEVGGVCVCHPDEEISGDDFALHDDGERVRLVLADGIGHGLGAAEAARAALDVFHAEPRAPLVELLDRMNRALAPTRGAAVGLAEIDRARRLVRFAGVGNTAGTIVAETGTRSVVSQHGTVGREARRLQEFTYPWPEEALFVMHSDGISSRWSLDRAPGLAARRAALIAGVLYRDFARGRDDATVVVVRDPP